MPSKIHLEITCRWVRATFNAIEGFEYFPTGSIVVNGQGKDIDIVLFHPNKDKAFAALVGYGYKRSIEGYPENPDAQFTSFRLGWNNIIVSHTREEFIAWKAATNVCKFISDGKMPKPVRVGIFKLIREGCSLREMHDDIIERFGGYEDVAPVDALELRNAVPLPNDPV